MWGILLCESLGINSHTADAVVGRDQNTGFLAVYLELIK